MSKIFSCGILEGAGEFPNDIACGILEGADVFPNDISCVLAVLG